jgi:hypothetical protein
MRLIDSNEWPEPSAALSPTGEPLGCWTIQTISMVSVRMKSDRDYLLMSTWLAGGAGVWSSYVYVLGSVEGSIAILWDGNYLASPQISARGGEGIVSGSFKSVHDASCCPSGRITTRLAFDPISQRVISSDLLEPSCEEGTVKSLARWETGSIRSLRLSCRRDGYQFDVMTSYSVGYPASETTGIQDGSRIRVEAVRGGFPTVAPVLARYGVAATHGVVQPDLTIGRLVVLP